MPLPDIDAIIQAFNLQPHPEGGFYRETYRAEGRIPRDCQNAAGRSYSTAIFYLLPTGAKSRLHRIASDELWHFYLGDPMTVVEISPDGRVQETVLGQDIAAGQQLQHMVPAGHWFGAYPNAGSRYALVGCTVAPGFEFADLELAEREPMLPAFPQAQEAILKLTD